MRWRNIHMESTPSLFKHIFKCGDSRSHFVHVINFFINLNLHFVGEKYIMKLQSLLTSLTKLLFHFY